MFKQTQPTNLQTLPIAPDGSAIPESIRQLNEFLEESGRSVKRFHNKLLYGLFGDEKFWGYSGFEHIREINNEKRSLIITMDTNSNLLNFTRITFFTKLLSSLTENCLDQNLTIPKKFFFRCATNWVPHLTEDLEGIAAARIRLVCQENERETGSSFAIENLRLISNYIIGNIVKDKSVEVQVELSDWTRYILKENIIEYDITQLMHENPLRIHLETAPC